MKNKKKAKKNEMASTPLVYLMAIPGVILSVIGAAIYWLTKKPAKR